MPLPTHRTNQHKSIPVGDEGLCTIMAPSEVTNLCTTIIDEFHGPSSFILDPHKDSSISITGCQLLKRFIPPDQDNLAVVASQIEVGPLRSISVPLAVAGGEGNTNNSSSVPGGQPPFLIVPSPAHRLLLLTFGNSAFP